MIYCEGVMPVREVHLTMSRRERHRGKKEN